MIKPTVGRVVWFYPNGIDGNQPFAASIAYVHSDRLINIGYINQNGIHSNATSVKLVQEEDEIADGEKRFCTWMPYQQEQAKKTEVAEAAVKGFKS